MAFNTNIFNEKQFRKSIDKLEELLLHSKAVLLGAGASKCAGLPLMNELTNNTLDSDISSDSKKILETIKDSFVNANPAAHIEDYLSELVDWLAITSRRANRNVKINNISINNKNYTHDQLTNAVDEIKKAIAKQINKNSMKLETHKRFVSALHKPMRPGKDNHIGCIDYLVMNYDTLIEDALALSKLQYTDGLAGGVSGWWEPSIFNSKNFNARVFKLHGSINWVEEPKSKKPLRIAPYITDIDTEQQKIMIWPASTKYRETQLDPYAHLMKMARDVLNPKDGCQRVLLIVGYSFGDAHINLEIERGLRMSNGNLTVIVFTSDEKPSGQLKTWNEDPRVNEQVLIYANNGFFHAEQKISSESGIEWWKFEKLTEILEGNI